MYRKALCYFTVLILAYAGIFWVMQAWAVIAAYIAFGLTAVLLGFNFAHDFSHNTIFRNKRANNLCFTLLYTLLGAHAEGWKHRHVSAHHYAPNVTDYDTDLQITRLIRVAPDSPHHWFHRYQRFYAPLAYTTYSLYWVFLKDFKVYASDCRTGRRLSYHASFWLQKAGYLVYLLVLPLWLGHSSPGLIFTGFLCMHGVQSLFLLLTFFMTHHVEATTYFHTDQQGFIQTSWISNQLRSSNDFYPFSKTANFIFGGFNNHSAHHLFPHIHHVHYPALNRILYPLLQRHGIEPNVTSYAGGVRSHLRHLQRMGNG